MWLDAWREKVGIEEAQRISKIATDRGERVHEFAERHFNGEVLDLTAEPKDIQLMTKALIKEASKHFTEVWAQELAVWSPTLKIAGRLDAVGIWKGKPTIIDFKTSKKKKTSSSIEDYYVQTCFYGVSHNELFNSKINNAVILIAVEDGTVQTFEIPIMPFTGHLKGRIKQYRKMMENDS